MDFNEKELDEDLKIDPSALDVECLRQGALCLKYGRIKAEIDRIAWTAAKDLKQLEVALLMECRQKPLLFGIKGVPTENSIKGAILLTQRYEEAWQATMAADYQASLAFNAVKAVEQRKQMIEELVFLRALNYFEGPSTPRNLKREWKLRRGMEIQDAKAEK